MSLDNSRRVDSQLDCADWPNILIIDDDKRICALLSKYLLDNGFMALTARDASVAREILSVARFDALVVDVMMPGETGLELTASIREQCDVPVLMLTALGESDDRITGLEAGADDYLPKPFEPRELVLRLRSLIRRSAEPAGNKKDAAFKIGDWRYETGSYLLTSKQETLTLTQMEASLIEALIKYANVPVDREILSKECDLENSERTIDVQVTRLRRKLEADPKHPRYLLTVRGKGYMLRSESD